jgi:tRNA G10  N-methylase Trm11
MQGNTTNRKPHSNNAGYVAERKCAAGGHVVIYDREKGFELDADKRWVVMHEPSSVHVAVRSRTMAYDVMKAAAIDPLMTFGVSSLV